MSELKEHNFCESDEFFREYPGQLSNEMRPYYLKSEADKFIADLEESHKMEVEQLLMEVVRLKDRVRDYVVLIQDYQQKLAETEESLRWRKACEELPTDETEVLVILDNDWRTTDYFDKDKGRWHYHWNTVAYWFPTPKEPEEDDK